MQTHHLPVDVQAIRDHRSIAQWSIVAPERLLVFIHGFNGSPEDTWEGFPETLSGIAADYPFDRLSLHYEARTRQANTSANQVLAFLDVFLSAPAATINRLMRFDLRKEDFSYRRIIFVAHSLGAVILRRALIDASRITPVPQWLSRCDMVLYAPAHNGALAADVLSSLMTGNGWTLGGLLGAASRFKAPLLRDLMSDSSTIKNLKGDTERLVAPYADPAAVPGYLRPRAIAWADAEDIVVNENFCWTDPIAKTITGRSHMSVCKPRSKTDSVFQLLEGVVP